MANQQPYTETLRDPRWRKKRLEVFQRDKFTCRKCHDRETNLVVHPKYYLPGKEFWDYPLESFVTLCASCHQEETADEALISAVKSKFNASGIQDLTQAFSEMELLTSSEQVASVYAWALRNKMVQKVLIKTYSGQRMGLKKGRKAIPKQIETNPFESSSFRGQEATVELRVKVTDEGKPSPAGYVEFAFQTQIRNHTNVQKDIHVVIQAIDKEGFELEDFLAIEIVGPKSTKSITEHRLMDLKQYRDFQQWRIKEVTCYDSD